MRLINATSACIVVALSTAAFAQNASDVGSKSKSLQQNASPTGPGAENRKGSTNTESGPAATEGRSSATDNNNSAGDANKK